MAVWRLTPGSTYFTFGVTSAPSRTMKTLLPMPSQRLPFTSSVTAHASGSRAFTSRSPTIRFR